jgi:hypothetical protein
MVNQKINLVCNIAFVALSYPGGQALIAPQYFYTDYKQNAPFCPTSFIIIYGSVIYCTYYIIPTENY